MDGHFHAGSMGLLRLPDEILLRLLRAPVPEGGTYKSDNLRDVWNVATTCRTLHSLTLKMMHSITLTHLELVEECVPRNVVTAMPDDVVQGALLALRSSYEGAGPLRQAIRVVRLGAMTRDQL
ncbi:hypothetical protein BWQ96_07532 [Gracilariopsis chorda]|uniref:F-box domain-containing protein n=1 Tax=Gracilariopsis chorda TaxID=448386 RepID=A0A2V3IKX6_9FLOR|nr:hypothetical protein BWQ96_07532 [Gracilariopsis chorda]|eukprot:PXF42717.1 hypothetical protein BWQ96_07532 [Gracilariopsis chorda]